LDLLKLLLEAPSTGASSPHNSTAAKTDGERAWKILEIPFCTPHRRANGGTMTVSSKVDTTGEVRDSLVFAGLWVEGPEGRRR
jgi:hypothetical protein